MLILSRFMKSVSFKFTQKGSWYMLSDSFWLLLSLSIPIEMHLHSLLSTRELGITLRACHSHLLLQTAINTQQPNYLLNKKKKNTHLHAFGITFVLRSMNNGIQHILSIMYGLTQQQFRFTFKIGDSQLHKCLQHGMAIWKLFLTWSCYKILYHVLKI